MGKQEFSENLGAAIATRGAFLWMTRPAHSVMLISSALAPPGNVQSNLCTRFANTISLVIMANKDPGQPLLPAPNGINWKSCPLKSTEEFKNLSGLNSSGSSHIEGSLPIVQALIRTMVLAAMS
ncbi:unnamed protein product [Prunus brigantina]